MTTTFRSVWEGAAFRADLSVTGVGPHASERVTDPEWRTLLNEAIGSAWRLAASARPDFQVKSQDFTVASGGSASFVVPSDFFDVIDVVFAPDTVSEYSLGPFAWANRRSPGGWFPANFGGTTNLGGSLARLMDSTIYIEPAMRAGGTYRLWYCPAPKLIRADATARLATAAALPACTASGAGVGKKLTGNAVGALSIDGVVVANGDLVLVKDQANAVDNGLYTQTQQGSGGFPFELTRSTSFDAVAELPLGLMVYTSSGATNVDKFFELTSTIVTVDVTAQTWVEAFINPILEQFSELLKILTALPVMVREDDLDPRPLMQRAYGADGKSGLAGELKDYFRQVRVNMGPSKVIDTDALGPAMPWGR
jgi:hypothetical protein